MLTVHKAGVTTGCGYCPNDRQCELQDVVEKMGVSEIGYPVYYRNVPVEKDDPFYDRDYNLCILCGRCIRVCQEVRTAATLAFLNRGHITTVGPAFGRTHLEAGCEFCGACVSVCPTGALSERAGKWEGEPDREVMTTCVLCGIGCRMRLLIKGGRVIGSLPADDPLISDGQLCVKGRFCVNELVNHYKRVKRPSVIRNGIKQEIEWDKAVAIAAEKLASVKPGEFGMLISPDSSNEDLYVAQKFTRAVMGSHHIDTSARMFYGPGFNAYMDLMRRSVPLHEIKTCSLAICIGLDTRFGRSVVGVELRKAVKNGAGIVTIHSRDHNLSSVADKWIQPDPGNELDVLKALVSLTGKGKTGIPLNRIDPGMAGDLRGVAGMAKTAASCVILVGQEFHRFSEIRRIFETIGVLAQNLGAGLIPLPGQANLYGSLITGCYSELLPGGVSSRDKKSLDAVRRQWGRDIPGSTAPWNFGAASDRKKIKVLYLVGESLPESFDRPDYLIYQNIYPFLSGRHADLVFPSTAFTEADGTVINYEGRVQQIKRGAVPPGEALPDWKILCRIAGRMGVKGFEYRNVREIRKEISGLIGKFMDFIWSGRRANPLNITGKCHSRETGFSGLEEHGRTGSFSLTVSGDEHTYRGFPLSLWVEGAKVLFDRTVNINPEDARKRKIENGDRVIVSSGGFREVFPVRISKEQPPGILHVTLGPGEFPRFNPGSATIRKQNVQNP
jgi:predicted molibdopterin-dependent oxidoreductase YjgC